MLLEYFQGRRPLTTPEPRPGALVRADPGMFGPADAARKLVGPRSPNPPGTLAPRPEQPCTTEVGHLTNIGTPLNTTEHQGFVNRPGMFLC